MQTQTTQRLAFTCSEFAAAFGRHPSWAYRKLYEGKVHAICELGRTLIPASELDRLLALAVPYDPKLRKAKTVEKK